MSSMSMHTAGCNVLLRAMLAAAGVVQAADGGVPA